MIVKKDLVVAAWAIGAILLFAAPASEAQVAGVAALGDKLQIVGMDNGLLRLAQDERMSRRLNLDERSSRSEDRSRGPRTRARTEGRRQMQQRRYSRETRRRDIRPDRRASQRRVFTRDRANPQHRSYIRRRSYWSSWCARNPGGCRRYRYRDSGSYVWYWVPLATVLLNNSVVGDRCEYYAEQCSQNWGYGNADFYGCLRYHNCN